MKNFNVERKSCEDAKSGDIVFAAATKRSVNYVFYGFIGIGGVIEYYFDLGVIQMDICTVGAEEESVACFSVKDIYFRFEVKICTDGF